MKGRKSWSKPYGARSGNASSGYALDTRMKKIEKQMAELIGWKRTQEVLGRMRAQQRATELEYAARRPIRRRRYWR